jgi:hypothetical protein
VVAASLTRIRRTASSSATGQSWFTATTPS